MQLEVLQCPSAIARGKTEAEVFQAQSALLVQGEAFQGQVQRVVLYGSDVRRQRNVLEVQVCRVQSALLLFCFPMLVPLHFHSAQQHASYVQVQRLACGVLACKGVQDELEVGLLVLFCLVQMCLGAEKLCVCYAYAPFQKRKHVNLCRQARSMEHGAVVLVLQVDVVYDDPVQKSESDAFYADVPVPQFLQCRCCHRAHPLLHGRYVHGNLQTQI